MKTSQKFSDSRFGRVLPFAMTCLIAAEFVACGNRNGAREIITSGVKQSLQQQQAKAASDPQIVARIVGASAVVGSSQTPNKIDVIVSLLIKSPQDPTKLLMIVANGSVGIGIVPAKSATPTGTSPQTKVDDTLDGVTTTSTQAPGSSPTTTPTQASKKDLLTIITQQSSRDIPQGIGLFAVCSDANCQTLSVIYLENNGSAQLNGGSSGFTTSVGTQGLSKGLRLQGQIGATVNSNNSNAAPTVSQGLVRMHFGASGSSNVMILEQDCASANGRACHIQSFDDAVKQAKAAGSGVTISLPAGQQDPNAGNATGAGAPGAGNGGAGAAPAASGAPAAPAAGTSGAGPAATTPTNPTTPAQPAGPTTGNAPANPAAGAAVDTGVIDASHQ